VTGQAQRRRAWILGTTSYLPEAWLTARPRGRAKIPDLMVFAPKRQLRLMLCCAQCGPRDFAVTRWSASRVRRQHDAAPHLGPGEAALRLEGVDLVAGARAGSWL